MSFHPRLSVDEECAGPIPFADEIEFWKQLGITNVGMISTKLEPIGWDRELVANSGINVSNVVAEEHCLMEALDFGAAMGADSVWLGTVGSIGSRLWNEAAADFVGRIGPVVDRADELGMPFAIQPTNSMRLDISFVFTFRDTVRLATEIGSGVVLELECTWYEPDIEQRIRDNIDRITLVQIGDSKLDARSSPNRAVIGDGDLPLERLLAMVLDAGYEGMFDLELVGPQIEAEGWAPATRRSGERASEMLDRLGA